MLENEILSGSSTRENKKSFIEDPTKFILAMTEILYFYMGDVIGNFRSSATGLSRRKTGAAEPTKLITLYILYFFKSEL